VRESVVISLNREVIVIASGDVAKMCWRQRFSGERLELHDVQDPRGGRDREKAAAETRAKVAHLVRLPSDSRTVRRDTLTNLPIGSPVQVLVTAPS
jgi:hypothetical protein